MAKEIVDAQFPMMDDVHRFLFKGFKQIRKDGRAIAQLRRYREALRRARRFVIDDDVVRATCGLSQHKAKIGTWAVLARLPYDSVWIELNLHTKVAEFERLGTLKEKFDPSKVSDRVGYLMQREPDSTRWIATEFVYLDGEVVPSPTVMVFDPEGNSYKQVTGSTLLKQPTYSLLDGSKPIKARVSANDRTVETLLDPEFLLIGSYDAAPQQDKNDIKAVPPAWAQFKVGGVIEPMWSMVYELPDRGQNGRDQLLRVAAYDMQERAGVLRWIICLLGSMNDAPLGFRTVHGRPGIRSVGSHRFHYFDHSVVSISVPRGKTARFLERALDEAATQSHRALHQVRGHFRVVDQGKKTAYVCRHIPLIMEDGLGICERCERTIRWIDDHQRGDPRIGIVEPSYVVRGK